MDVLGSSPEGVTHTVTMLPRHVEHRTWHHLALTSSPFQQAVPTTNRLLLAYADTLAGQPVSR